MVLLDFCLLIEDVTYSVGPLPDGAGRYGFLKFLEAALVPILTSGDVVTNVNRLASEGKFLCICRFL